MSKIHCDVSLNTIDCEFPACAEGGEKPIRTRCFSCGQRACRTCSSVRPYAIYRVPEAHCMA